MKLGERVKNAIIGAGFVAANLIVCGTYSGQYKNLVKGYGHDVLLPTSAFFIYKARGGIWNKNRYATAAFIFSGCSAFELAQAAGLYPGTFDPKDFLAYAAGTALALGVDSIISRKQKTLDDTIQ